MQTVARAGREQGRTYPQGDRGVVGVSRLRVGKRKQKFRPPKEVCAPKAESQSTRCGGRCTTTCMGSEAFTELKYPMDYSSCILVHCTHLGAAEIMMHLNRFSPHHPGHLDHLMDHLHNIEATAATGWQNQSPPLESGRLEQSNCQVDNISNSSLTRRLD